jgi:hypothetical protein
MPGLDPADTGTWEPPALDDCDEERWPIGLDADNILSVRRVLWNGQLVAFAIVLSRRIGDRWLEMVCIDTLHHGCVHRHDGDHAAPYKEMRPIREQADVQESFHEAYDEVYNVYLKSIGSEPLR